MKNALVIILITASWYSNAYCLGCNAKRIMANGEKLDDNAFTVAYNKGKKNSYVMLCDRIKCIKAKITDRMGRKDRIDLTPALFKQFAPLERGLIKLNVISL